MTEQHTARPVLQETLLDPSIPTGTNAGTYYVWYKVDTADSTNCLSKSATYKGSVTINQKSITITAPTINTATLIYTATDKTLASNGSVSDTTGATFKIGLGSSGSSAPTTWHSSDAITAVNAGTYYVWYKAVLNDSTNYTVDTSNHYLGSKAIGKAALTVTGSSHTVTYGDAKLQNFYRFNGKYRCNWFSNCK